MNLLLIAAAVVLLVIVGAVLVRAIGGNITILDHWKQAWKFYSTWFLLLLESPNIWNAAIAAGVFEVEAVPGEFAWMTRIASCSNVHRALHQAVAEAARHARVDREVAAVTKSPRSDPGAYLCAVSRLSTTR